MTSIRPLTSMRRVVVLLTIIAAVLGGAACGGDAEEGAANPVDDHGTSSGSSGSDEDGDEDAASDSFPVTVSVANGEVTIAERPERIVSLSAALTEMIFAVGAGDQVVAVDEYSNFPPEAPTTELSGFRPSAEAIAGYEPSLVFVSNDRDGIVGALEGLGLTVVHLPSADSVEHALDQMVLVATVTGHEEAGAALVADVGDQLDALAATAGEGSEPVTYYYELSDTYHSATSDSFVGSLLALANFRSIADEVGDASNRFPQLSAEFILGADPDLILVAVPGDGAARVAEIAARPGWDQLTAVSESRIVALDQDIATRWGPRLVELLAAVVDAAGSTGLR